MTDLTLFHAPKTRSFGTLLLLEELGVPHDLQVLDFAKEEQLGPAFRSVNPLGKVPTIRHRGAVVTEQVAIALYLADEFPEKGLAPPVGDALRGPYVRWMVFYAACFEPAMVDRAQQRDAGRRMMSPYGDFDTVMQTVNAQVAGGPWFLGERFTAADVIWGTALDWMTRFKVVPGTPEIAAYVGRVTARPAMQRARAREDALSPG
jgi:glutathione S-transferase